MPTYNRADLIMETIESIRGQTFKNWELIIVDDGSEDNTEQVVGSIKDERISFYKAGKIGIGLKLKYIGIKKAKGDMIAFIDSDDLWDNTKLEKQIAAFQLYPDAAFSLTGGYNFKKKDEPLEYFYNIREGIKFGNIFTSFFTSEASILPQTLLFKRECLDLIKQFSETSPSSDVEFILGLALSFNAVLLYEPLLFRRIHGKNFTNSNWERGFDEGIAVTIKYKNSKDLPSGIAKNSLFNLYINYGERCLAYKRRRKALRNFMQSWRYKPFSIVSIKKIAKAILSYF